MGFLDNSGDIILDAVLTDTGRMRMARGDGTFKIAKFALGDDEINYTLYRNANNSKGAHPSGSAYYDLDILQTPVLEAFTNNTSFLKSKLITLSNTNLLYLPVLQLNETASKFARNSGTAQALDKFVVTVDETTSKFVPDGLRESGDPVGVINGLTGDGVNIRVDQGLDTQDIDPSQTLDKELYEPQYLIEMDNRFGRITSMSNNAGITPSFIDDDNIAAYYVTDATDGDFVRNNANTLTTADANQTIAGPRGSILEFKILSSIELQRSNTMFTKVGVNDATWTDSKSVSNNVRYIDSTVRVTGLTTGYRLDIPVRFIKLR
jgi:hypothetical protein|tara:strand:+ start:3220 stop:4182 length:963 start_codon:yes stop_codon:yes gene_type:complete